MLSSGLLRERLLFTVTTLIRMCSFVFETEVVSFASWFMYSYLHLKHLNYSVLWTNMYNQHIFLAASRFTKYNIFINISNGPTKLLAFRGDETNQQDIHFSRGVNLSHLDRMVSNKRSLGILLCGFYDLNIDHETLILVINFN